MRMFNKFSLTALVVTASMAAEVSSALATRIEVSNQRYAAIWALLRFEVEGVTTVECPVTLEGSFHSRAFSKVSGELIGYVTGVKVRGARTECNGSGTARANTETLPWYVRFSSWTGILPNIASVTVVLVGADYNVDPEGLLFPNCRARTEAGHPGVGIAELAAGGVARTLRADERSKIPLGGSCPIEGESNFRERAEVFVLGSARTRIVVRLVQ